MLALHCERKSERKTGQVTWPNLPFQYQLFYIRKTGQVNMAHFNFHISELGPFLQDYETLL